MDWRGSEVKRGAGQWKGTAKQCGGMALSGVEQSSDGEAETVQKRKSYETQSNGKARSNDAMEQQCGDCQAWKRKCKEQHLDALHKILKKRGKKE